MPFITSKYKDKELHKYHMNIGQTIMIGRSDSNDIVIDNPAVSGVHAKIVSVNKTVIITDLKTTNGTFVNRRPISDQVLKNNDVVLIGKHELVIDLSDHDWIKTFHDTERQEAETRFIDISEYNKDFDDEKTRYLDTTEYRELIDKTKGQGASASRRTSIQVNQNEKGNFFSRLLKKMSG